MDHLLGQMSAATLIAMWRDLARAMLSRGIAGDWEVSLLNTIAIAYGRKLGTKVYLSGRPGEGRV